jgi:crossover junction endodeoxyribonuclease RusA
MPNRKNGKHWGATHAAKGEAWKAGYYLTHEAMKRHSGVWFSTRGQVPVTLTFCLPDKRKRDLDNLLAASKAVLDGVAAALLMDDREFEPVTLKRGEARKGGAMVLEVGS